MKAIQLDKDTFRDKVLACWLGKNIGGTLGTPLEGQRHVHDLTFYDPVPSEPLPNDDLDFQLVWLKMLEAEGPDPPLPTFAEYWKKYLYAYPWNEYGFCMRNLDRGLMPPISGCFENYFVDEMGSPIRSEIWACTSPADPQLAAARAWKDSALDHAGGEGTYGEMFWAAVQSAAFVIDDPLALIRIGLAMIPLSCAISRAVREAVWCHQNGLRWAEARQRIADVFGHRQPCHAPPNHAFTVLGWLYGEDFGDCLCKAVNCGYDTDCTGATLGATLGIIGGTAAIPARWREPIGDRIVLHNFTAPFDAPADVHELTERTCAVARRAVAELPTAVRFGEGADLPDDLSARLMRNELARRALARDVHCAEAADGDLIVRLHYGGEPVIYPGLAKVLEVSMERGGVAVEEPVKLEGPQGWSVRPVPGGHNAAFEVRAEAPEPRNDLIVRTDRRAFRFCILGPQEAHGYPATQNVPRCPTCQGYQGHCACLHRRSG